MAAVPVICKFGRSLLRNILFVSTKPKRSRVAHLRTSKIFNISLGEEMTSCRAKEIEKDLPAFELKEVLLIENALKQGLFPHRFALLGA